MRTLRAKKLDFVMPALVYTERDPCAPGTRAAVPFSSARLRTRNVTRAQPESQRSGPRFLRMVAELGEIVALDVQFIAPGCWFCAGWGGSMC